MRTVIQVNGPAGHDGRLTAHWNDWSPAAEASVTGRIGGRPVKLSTPAP